MGLYHQRFNETEVSLKGIESENTISSKSIKEIEESIQINTYLIENNIEPIFDQVSMQGFNFIRVFLNNPISIILIILIIILSADIMSSEFDSNTYKLLFIQPISRKKILLSKDGMFYEIDDAMIEEFLGKKKYLYTETSESDDIGVVNGFIQDEGSSSTDFVPDFNLQGVLKK